MDENSQQAIIQLLNEARLLERANVSANKESFWGLDECLEWLAANCDKEELPDYESHQTVKRERLLREANAIKEKLKLGKIFDV